MPNLTKRIIEATKPPETGQIFIWDTRLRGFGVSIKPRTPDGTVTRSFIIQYKVRTVTGWRNRRMVIGRWNDFTPDLLDDMRKMAGELLADRQNDPLAQKRAIPPQRGTVADLVNQYLDAYASGKKSGDEDRRILAGPSDDPERQQRTKGKKRKRVDSIVSLWGKRYADDITRADVREVLRRIVKRGAPTQANRTLAILRKCFNWAIAMDLLQTNPCWQVQAPAKESKRDRVLDPQEIKDFWENIERVDVSHEVQVAIKLVLVTGQRPGEVIGVEWSELDLQEGWWQIPAFKAKNSLTHRVPLSPLARELFASMPRRGPFVFHSEGTTRGHVHVGAMSHALARAFKPRRVKVDGEVVEQPPVLSCPAFRPHDLRRTAASRMAESGVSRIVIGKILNHADRTVTATYERYGYHKEMALALNAWSARIERILAGKDTAEIIDFPQVGA